MKHFTRGWHAGELSDEECAAAAEAYAHRLHTIDSRLTPALRTLAHEVCVHDAIVERVIWSPGEKELLVALVTYEPEGRSHRAVELVYSGAMLSEQRLEMLRVLANDRRTEVLAHEVDVDDDGTFAHRLIFAPEGELTIGFVTLRLVVDDRADDRVRLGPAFLERREDD